MECQYDDGNYYNAGCGISDCLWGHSIGQVNFTGNENNSSSIEIEFGDLGVGIPIAK